MAETCIVTSIAVTSLGCLLLPSRSQSRALSASVFIASIGLLLLGNIPSAASENARGRASATGISWDSVCRTDGSEGVDCDAHAFPTGNAVLVEFSKAPGIASDSDWFVGSWAGRQFPVEDGQPQFSGVQDIPLVDDRNGAPADETPPGARVPEPATMVLVGIGMITMSRISRIRRPPQKQSRQLSALVSTY